MRNLQKIPPTVKNTMRGAGLLHGKIRFLTHTTLHHSQSALFTFAPWQTVLMIFLLAQIVFGLIVNPLITITVIIGALSLIYFIDVIFNIYVILKSLNKPPEIKLRTDQIKKLDDRSLPLYSILCPLYQETRVLPEFIESIKNLNWPKEKLEVLLLLEEDDRDTVNLANSLDLPKYVKKIIVPPSSPKTKPKACNFGLSCAKGEYLVVFDAEDRPEPDQLKKAYLGFKKLPQDVVCLQAKLNYYNPHQNLLTRLFTAEYSLWFGVILTGLQSISTAIPLGGTSNHFKTKVLKKLEGWDPFNVTEDCDLGVRLFKRNYKTAIIDSTTWEEANSNVKNWLRQRSRWIKGYLQTFLVHNRWPVQFIKEQGVHAFIFQLVIGARMSFMLINPILWLMTISYFTLYGLVGSTIESFYPAPIFYMAVFSLAFGNFMYIFNYMIGLAKRGQWNLIKFVYLVPFYWLMASISAGIALYQLLVKPHYWEKTIHGLHLEKQTAEVQTGLAGLFSNNKIYFGGALLVGASVTAHFLNFVFNAYLGRVLEFGDFALIGLISAFLSFSSILFGAFSTTANFRSGFLIGKYGENAAFAFWNFIRERAIFTSAIMTLIWLLLTPLLMRYFDTNNVYPFVLFGLVLFFGLASGANNGFLSSKLKFGSLAMIYLSEPVVKLTAAASLVYFGLNSWTFSAIPMGSVAVFISGMLLIHTQIRIDKDKLKDKLKDFEIKKFPKRFFTASLLTQLSTVAFFTVDIILANHFLPAKEAGQYTLLSLSGKMVYFLGSLLTPFVTPFVSRDEGKNKDSQKTLFNLVASTTVLSLGAFIAFGWLGDLTIPLLYGSKAQVIVPYLPQFTFGMMCFVIAVIFLRYYLVKRVYSFAILAVSLVILQIILININHASFAQIATMTSFVWETTLLTVLFLHLNIKYVRIFEASVKNFLLLLVRKQTPTTVGLNILIFNWRDIHHKWAGGAEIYVHELAKRWVKDGNNVTLFCGNGTRRPNEKVDGIQIIRRGNFVTVYIWAFFYYIFIFRGKYDVIIDCENGIPFFTPLYSRKPKFLLIHHVHQEVFRKSLITPLAALATFLETKLMPVVYKNIQVITVSPSSKEEILKHNLTATDPMIIYNGVDSNKFKPGVKSKLPLVLYLGRLQYYKSLHVFINAAKKISYTNPEARFVVSGEGEEKNNLIKYARKLKIADKIKFLGRVTEAQKIKLFQRAWVFVNPSFMEGWGLTTIEANACATPAVAADVPGLRDSISNPHTGILVPYGKSNLFAQAILKLIKDKNLRTNLSKEAVKWSKNFSWEKSAGEFYRAVLNKVPLSTKLLEKGSLASS